MDIDTDTMDKADAMLLEKCRAIATGTWSDALDECGIDGLVEGLVQRAGAGRIASGAPTRRSATAEQVAMAYRHVDSGKFGVPKIVAAARPGRIVMVTSGGAPVSSFGGIASLAASKQGATGIVIDGGCRDVDEIREAGLWLASRHVTPRTGKYRLNLVGMGGPITIGGVRVTEGDLVVADDTGIVAVPRARLDQVLTVAEAAAATDGKVEEAVRAGVSFGKAAARTKYLPASED